MKKFINENFKTYIRPLLPLVRATVNVFSLILDLFRNRKFWAAIAILITLPRVIFLMTIQKKAASKQIPVQTYTLS